MLGNLGGKAGAEVPSCCEGVNEGCLRRSEKTPL
jgi:hypothetical protein